MEFHVAIKLKGKLNAVVVAVMMHRCAAENHRH